MAGTHERTKYNDNKHCRRDRIAGCSRRPRTLQADMGFAGRGLPDARTGSATPSSASGRTGARNACPSRATGMRGSMYMQGNRQYEHHVKTYGHPSKVGFMEIAQPLEGRALGSRRADGPLREGRRASTSSRWPTTTTTSTPTTRSTTPGTRCASARRRTSSAPGRRRRARAGLRFGVSNHSAHAWHWFQAAYGYDPEGPLRRPALRRLQPHQGRRQGQMVGGPRPAGALHRPQHGRCRTASRPSQRQRSGTTSNDRHWDEKPPPANPAFVRQLVPALPRPDRQLPAGPGLLRQHRPAARPGRPGHRRALLQRQHRLARRQARGRGQRQGAAAERSAAALVEDVERGSATGIEPLPWQTDTCIGDWHYNRARLRQPRYKSAAAGHPHARATSSRKNGNLLLNIPVRGDGTIDADERAILDEHGSLDGPQRRSDPRHAARGAASAKARPRSPAACSARTRSQPFTAEDIRFTTKAGALYAIALGWPRDGKSAHRRALATGLGAGAGRDRARGDLGAAEACRSRAPARGWRCGSQGALVRRPWR